jgi:hypothetical protein
MDIEKLHKGTEISTNSHDYVNALDNIEESEMFKRYRACYGDVMAQADGRNEHLRRRFREVLEEVPGIGPGGPGSITDSVALNDVFKKPSDIFGKKVATSTDASNTLTALFFFVILPLLFIYCMRLFFL